MSEQDALQLLDLLAAYAVEYFADYSSDLTVAALVADLADSMEDCNIPAARRAQNAIALALA